MVRSAKNWLGISTVAGMLPPTPATGLPGDAGLFGPQSAAWLVFRERITLAGGPTALLLQLAHPLVCAGVAEHSGFEEDPLRRLRATLDATLTVIFGDHDQAQMAVAAVARRHRAVQGRLRVGTGNFAAGTPYRADDPELAMWVFATLVWTAMKVTSSFLGPVAAAERDAYYADMRQFGLLFGATPTMPTDYAALDAYVHQMTRDVLVVSSVTHRLARQVLMPEPPLLPPPLRALPTLLAAGLLPATVRHAYALPWRRRDRIVFAGLRTATRSTVPALPPSVRFWPHYRIAQRRLSG
jgi:uncharacterized protein (DUF2236 family)